MVRPQRSLALLLAAGFLCSAGEARAQYMTARSLFAGAFEYTDNSNFVAMNAVQPAERTSRNEVVPRPAFTIALNPSVIGSYETPRSLNELQYTFNFASAFGINTNVNYTNRLELRTRYDVSDLLVTNFALRATQGQQTMFPEPQPGQAVALVVPGTFTFGTFEVAEALNRRLSPDLVFTQQLGGNVFYPIDAKPARAQVFAANLAMALQYNDDPTNYAITLNSQFAAASTLSCEPPSSPDIPDPCGANRTCAVATHTCVFNNTITPESRAKIEAQTNAPMLGSRLGGTVRHDFKNGFTTELDLGVQQLMRLTDAGGQNWGPAGRIAIRFAEQDIQAALTFNHGTQLNIELGNLVLGDNLDLVGILPLDRQARRWMLQLQTGYQRGTLIDAFGSLLPGFQVIGGDLALAYRPENWLPNMAVALRYQIRYQITEPAATGGTANYELYTLRNAVGLTVGFEYPERRPVQ